MKYRAKGVFTLIVCIIMSLNVFAGTLVTNGEHWEFGKTSNAITSVIKKGYMTLDKKRKFNPADSITIKDAISIFNRIYTSSNYDNMLLYPKDLVNSKSGIAGRWVKLTKIIETKNSSFTFDLVPNHVRINLSKDAVALMKQGVIPDSLLFYSDKSSAFDMRLRNKAITKGFFLELVCLADMLRSGMVDNELRNSMLGRLTVLTLENSIGLNEKKWSKSDIDKYDYLAISYCGAMTYSMLKGYSFDSDVSNMNKCITREEAGLIISRFISTKPDLALKDKMSGFLKTNDLKLLK